MFLIQVCVSCLFLLALAVYEFYGLLGVKAVVCLLLYIIVGNIVIHIIGKRQEKEEIRGDKNVL